MKKSTTEKKDQDNIGYENTKTENDQDTVENNRMQTTNTGHNEGPKENEKDTAGLRSESGSKTTGEEAGNKVK